MTARDTLVTTLEGLFARTRNGRMDVHRAEAERLVDDALKEQAGALSEGLFHVADSGLCCVSQVDGLWDAAERLANDFDALIRASVERAGEKRKARLYPYDLEVT